MLIRNYGLYWSEEKVFWGYPKVQGTLLGVPRGAITSKPVDFRDQISVYVLYDDYRPVYVGQSASSINTSSLQSGISVS